MRRWATALACLLVSNAHAQEAPPASEALDGIPAQQATIEGTRAAPPGTTRLDGADAASLTGAHGDALVAAQSLPGTARPPLGSGQLVVWGAAPQETRLLVDGIEVPTLFHAGGASAVLPTALVQELSLAPAAFGAQLGRALGGVLSIETASLAPAPAEARVALSPLDVHAVVQGQLGGARIAVGARRSLLDLWLDPLLTADARALFPLAQSWDAQLLARVPLGAQEHLELLLFGSSDVGSRTLAANDPTAARGDSMASRWARLGARYQSARGDGSEVSVLVYVGDDYAAQTLFAGPAFAAQSAWTQSLGLRASQKQPLGSQVSLELGADALYARAHLRRTGSLTAPAREGDVFAFGRGPGLDVAFDDWSVTDLDAALYASATAWLGPLSVAPGLRLSAHATDTSLAYQHTPQTTGIGLSQLEWFAEPRLSASWRATDHLHLLAALGLHHQAADPADRSAVFGTPALTSSAAWHASLGAALRPALPFTLEATAFLRALDQLTSRSPLPTPQPASALVQEGSGLVTGLQLTARLRPGGALTGSLSLTLTRSQRTDLPDTAARLFDFDSPIAVLAEATWRTGALSLGGRVRCATGFPRTPVVGSLYNAQAGAFDPLFGDHNSTRLPFFAQVDLRVAHTFSLTAATRLDVFLEVQNAFARANAEEFAYSADWSVRAPIAGLPPLALLGLELTL